MFINIWTEKSCLFVHMSKKLLAQLKKYPLLYYAIEEALISESNGYYSIWIIIWYDLLRLILNVNNKLDSNERNIPAHEILKTRPTKESYNNLLCKFKWEAEKVQLKEIWKYTNKKEYYNNLAVEWNEFINNY